MSEAEPSLNLVEFLREVEIFQNMTRVSAERVVGEASRRRFDAGTKIISRGEAGDCMFLILEGQVQVPVFDEDGRELFVAQLGPKQIFGEMALLTGEARLADVYAMTDCECLMLSRAAVEDLIRRHTEVAQFLTAIVGERLMKSGAIRKVGKYRLVDELDRGGMSIVYEGIHPALERPVAIKMLAHEMVYRPHFQERFRNEAKIISRLQHPHIVEVYDTEQAYATFFIVMERLRGRPLDEVILSTGRIQPPHTRRVLIQLASALSYAHREGIVHRDVKPSNVFVGPDGTVKLMDFGLALDSRIDPEEGEEAGTAAGTPMYMAPEQIGGLPVDGRSDIYSLGIMTWEMLVGEPPFTGRLFEILRHQQMTPLPSLEDYVSEEIPRDLVSFVERAASKDPDDRFQSCDEILEHFGVEQARRPLMVDEMSVRTLTLLFRSGGEAEVDRLVDDVQRRVLDLDDVYLF